ncbi:MAG: alpha/beta hydrolase [Gammaproteobacteria bacterium]|nr:alpha/beta hydrolase [Gammaproteobacteria bacterium]
MAFIYLAPARAVTAALTATRKQSGLVRKEITLPDGLRYVYLEGGQGESLLLLHGFGGNKDSYTRVSRFFVRRYRVIIPDIIGFGESARPPHADYLPPAQVEWLRALSQALNLGRLHLGGNSMGGQIALLYAALYPTEVHSLWLLSPAVAKNSFKPDIVNLITRSGRNPLIARNVQEFAQVMALGMCKPPFIPAPMLKVLAQERIQNAVLEERIFQKIIDYSVEDQIHGMPIPTLVVFGKQDRVIDAETANVLSKRLPNSKVVFMPNAGHVPMFEQPRQCANDYLSFGASMLARQGKR